MSDLPNNGSRLAGMARGFWRGLWSTEGSIAQKSVRGATWMLAGMGVIQVFQVGQQAVMARLLLPRDFGLQSLALAALAASSIFSQFGVSQALVQRKKMTRRFMDTAWMLDLIRNVMMFVGAYFVAAPMAAFYKEPQLTLIIRISSLKFLMIGLSNNSGMVMLSREMNFRRLQIYEIVLNLTGVATTVVLGFWLRNVWALVLPPVFCYGLGEMIGSYILHPFRPRFRIYWTETRALFSFSKHVFMGGILMFLRGSLARLLLGKLLGADAVGYYSLAQSLVARPVVLISSVFGNVLYPAFSRLQDRIQSLRRAFLRAMGVGCLALGPVLVGTAVTAQPLVRVFYGKGWEPVVPISVLFCLVQFILFLQRPAGIVLAARGKPGLNNLGKILHPFIFVPLLIPLALRYETRGVVAALGAAAGGETVLLIVLACREMELSLLDVGRAIAGPTLASILMGLGVWAVGTTISLPAVPTLAILVPLGVVLYGITSALLNRHGWADALRAFTKASGPDVGLGLATGGAENA